MLQKHMTELKKLPPITTAVANVTASDNLINATPQSKLSVNNKSSPQVITYMSSDSDITVVFLIGYVEGKKTKHFNYYKH